MVAFRLTRPAMAPSSGGSTKGLDAEVVAILSAIENLDREANRRTLENIGWQAAIARLRDENAALDSVVDSFDGDERRVAELRYGARSRGDGASNYDIARELCCSEGRVRYIHRRAVLRAAQALNLYKQGQ